MELVLISQQCKQGGTTWKYIFMFKSLDEMGNRE